MVSQFLIAAASESAIADFRARIAQACGQDGAGKGALLVMDGASLDPSLSPFAQSDVDALIAAGKIGVLLGNAGQVSGAGPDRPSIHVHNAARSLATMGPLRGNLPGSVAKTVVTVTTTSGVTTLVINTIYTLQDSVSLGSPFRLPGPGSDGDQIDLTNEAMTGAYSFTIQDSGGATIATFAGTRATEQARYVTAVYHGGWQLIQAS